MRRAGAWTTALWVVALSGVIGMLWVVETRTSARLSSSPLKKSACVCEACPLPLPCPSAPPTAVTPARVAACLRPVVVESNCSCAPTAPSPLGPILLGAAIPDIPPARLGVVNHTALLWTYSVPSVRALVPTNDEMVGQIMRADGRFDVHITAAMKALAGADCRGSATANRLERPGIIVDVGANIGYHTLYAASLGCARVIAFEPMPAAVRFARDSILLNPTLAPRITLYHAAAASEVAERAIVTDEAWANSYLLPYGLQCADAPGTLCTMVPTLPLDDVLLPLLLGSGEQAEILVLKIDVEGYEKHVLDGALQTLKTRRVRNVLLECWPMALRRAGTRRGGAELLEMMQDLGYRIRRLPYIASERVFADMDPPMRTEQLLEPPWETGILQQLEARIYPSGRRGGDLWLYLPTAQPCEAAIAGCSVAVAP